MLHKIMLTGGVKYVYFYSFNTRFCGVRPLWGVGFPSGLVTQCYRYSIAYIGSVGVIEL